MLKHAKSCKVAGVNRGDVPKNMHDAQTRHGTTSEHQGVTERTRRKFLNHLVAESTVVEQGRTRPAMLDISVET